MSQRKPQNITLLGGTGSIGGSTLDIVARHSDLYRLYAVSGYRRVHELAEICRQFEPVFAVVPDQDAADQLEAETADLNTTVLVGADALEEVAAAEPVDIVVAAIVGAAGLLPALAAVKAGKRILLANKEALVMSGQLFMDEVRRSGAELLPIDSEHNAIFQCLPAQGTCFDDDSLPASGVRQILLTASGGPFRGYNPDQLAGVTPEQAVAHPNWSMGQKISVDSASLMNKGLELIEACWLFSVKPEAIQVVVHPQSIIHSMVSYNDGSVIAQMGNPDMRTPIAYGLAWPDRIDAGVKPLDLFQVAQLDFEPADEVAFPCLALARQAFSLGGTAPAILNAANEVAVQAFLDERIGFEQIPELCRYALDCLPVEPAVSLDIILASDCKAREICQPYLEHLSMHRIKAQ
ncbi:1-deoxy-D-xylulose-5-phosphate reductoisomerase [Oceanospirillum linum]|uniref:1-deoxy-D-xylulose 5-phosphate reductoisomerase n=1 Tax=Oceanospirillum linum TaxID=966 RepID=A0A1T1HFJ5_OCELI|nr:1-deoxy-D-xylulose-5-phosphate reductoisomerase [Oceanospirillum linum]OOV88638.1 1-deoxy-D-xylulose-5-phosphate reductoisomerase [Oceanospirillum linum]SEG04497.1 1-deoxy-D-xylulose 5-phosphate reductoisomerase [Oleiphilus messinensis]SMP20953.1 1-deoxy-D-xylulose 5-phosphate reductoisomerase [Oceanospirillum linum]